MLYKLFIILIVVIQVVKPARAVAQPAAFSYNSVPLNQPVNIRLLGADKEALQCYNLYGFVYVTDMDSVTGEFIVLKAADTFQNKEGIQVTLCSVKEFSILAGNACRAIKVESGIQLKYPGREEMTYLNFDPDIPDAVFIPCK